MYINDMFINGIYKILFTLDIRTITTMGIKLEKWRSRTNLTFWTLITDHPL